MDSKCRRHSSPASTRTLFDIVTYIYAPNALQASTFLSLYFVIIVFYTLLIAFTIYFELFALLELLLHLVTLRTSILFVRLDLACYIFLGVLHIYMALTRG